MIEIIKMEQKPVTDYEAAEAINTIKRYCGTRHCLDCTIQEVCEEYFDRSDCDPAEWPEVEVPDA